MAEVERVPVHCNRLLATEAEALAAPQASIRLAFCPDCGHAFNAVFDATKMNYAIGYENSLSHSASFCSYAQSRVRHLVTEYDLVGKRAVEIGCGDGAFLRDLIEAGMASGCGIDPVAQAGVGQEGPLRLLAEPFGPAHRSLGADLIICRHVLEHFEQPGALLQEIRAGLARAEETLLYVEVPDARFMYASGAPWDLIYEHCGYFSATSLCRLLSMTGFGPISVEEGFGGQFLSVVARSRAAGAPDQGEPPAGWRHEVEQYEENCKATLAHWRRRLEQYQSDACNVWFWGAGSKGVTFLARAANRQNVDRVVDINDAKAGHYVPGTAHQIWAPGDLTDVAVGKVIVANQNYLTEIEAALADLGKKPELTSLISSHPMTGTETAGAGFSSGSAAGATREPE